MREKLRAKFEHDMENMNGIFYYGTALLVAVGFISWWLLLYVIG